MLLAVSCGLSIAATCAFCALQPDKVAAYVRRKHLGSPRWIRNWPFAGMVMKEWYPVYLRVMGIGGLVVALVWLTLLIRFFSK
jgi:hypothetical protein